MSSYLYWLRSRGPVRWTTPHRASETERDVLRSRIGVPTAIFFVLLSLLVFRPEYQIRSGKPFVEDAYYSLSVARNLSAGHGLTIDGRNWTNGFQPLFTAVSTVSFLAAGHSDVTALRIQMILHLLVILATVLLLSGLLSSVLPRAIPQAIVSSATAALGFSACTLLSFQLNGLETGLSIFGYAAVLYLYVKRGVERRIDLVLLSALLGALVLTRIDAVFFVILFATSEMAAHITKRPGEALRRGAVMGVGAFLISSPWWLYNYLKFGSLMPSSGSVLYDSSAGWSRTIDAVSAAGWNLVPWVYSPKLIPSLPRTLAATIGLALLLGATVFLLKRDFGEPDPDGRATQRLLRFRRGLFVLLLHGCTIMLWYARTNWAVPFYPRYLAVFGLIGLILTAAFAIPILSRAKKLLILLQVLAAIMLSGMVWIYWTGRLIKGNDHYAAVELAQTYVPAEDWVGAGQSGMFGFFRPRVLNLDGKVNNEALRNRASLGRYIDRKRLNWLVDWPGYIERFIGKEPPRQGWQLVGSSRGFFLYHRVMASAPSSR